MEKVKKFITVAGAKNIELRPDMIFNLKKYTIIAPLTKSWEK